MKKCITANKYKLAALLIVLGLWWCLSRVYSPLVVPPIGSVALKVLEILKSPNLWTEIGRTVLRLIYGLGIGVGIGCIAGLIGGCIREIKQLLIPVLGIIQVVPPISWLILAIIWFGLNGRASIFIVVMAVVPTMFICISDGIAAIDKRLLEMGDVFGFSSFKKLRFIMIPSVLPFFGSGLKIAVGMACKTVVMGEVLTTTTGIGGQIMTARLNIEPETIIAWTVIVVGIYYAALYAGRAAVRMLSRLFKKKSAISSAECFTSKTTCAASGKCLSDGGHSRTPEMNISEKDYGNASENSLSVGGHSNA